MKRSTRIERILEIAERRGDNTLTLLSMIAWFNDEQLKVWFKEYDGEK